ncbi:hypothetical protein N7448_001352 [Penicillium atrosanguineum]|uniref:Oleate hydratase n=1 Tax=Penicillium atrosanguineum TaxID=1132637 RepID=A0A9W9LDH2_9EURO|nr:uncharacterized protein N7443_004750 [Penicillium atrosanguineum]KAJ5149774.1 hypothetical protein N7448_001352 [Penicillium atrosanguineum]KAJ5305090.1 hypothetical protein N7443_004750 [Penicillium atrosanguineum]KAJ5324558.1 hypothetical protein N7476_003158 [Penicillium atrosanguineum]
MKKFLRYDRRPSVTAEAWILGSGTASLAAAVYLIRHAMLPPSSVHILDEHISLEHLLHREGSSSTGYDQFAGCLPIPVGRSLQELLDMIPSAGLEERSFLDDIHEETEKRLALNSQHGTCFVSGRDGSFKHLPTKRLNLGIKDRFSLIRLLLKHESHLHKRQIQEFFRAKFFESTFWEIWSIQFGFQPWHSATEFRRSVRQYLSKFSNFSILTCLDITGYYQYDSILLPIYFYLQGLGVDFQFNTKVANVETSASKDRIQTIVGLSVRQDELDLKINLGPDDIVIATLGSTVSGSAIGTNNLPPAWRSVQPSDHLDENWSLWLEAGNKYPDMGDPYTFCTRKSESMMESFTITTEHMEFFDYLNSLSRCKSEAGAIFLIKDSSWGLCLCTPAQPVFTHQPPNVRVLWGFGRFPEEKGDCVNNSMVYCCGAQIMAEIVHHLELPSEMAAEVLLQSITIPRAMPRMSSTLLTRSSDDRPRIIPKSVSNLGLVGSFVEIPGRTCVDTGYGVDAARIAVSHLMGLEPWTLEYSEYSHPSFSRLLGTLILR